MIAIYIIVIETVLLVVAILSNSEVRQQLREEKALHQQLEGTWKDLKEESYTTNGKDFIIGFKDARKVFKNHGLKEYDDYGEEV